jgi:hypothetical protein
LALSIDVSVVAGVLLSRALETGVRDFGQHRIVSSCECKQQPYMTSIIQKGKNAIKVDKNKINNKT